MKSRIVCIVRQIPINKQFISRFPTGEFEVVYPFQQRERSDRTNVDTRIRHSSSNSTTHYKHTTVVIRSSYFGRFKLFLSLKEFIFANDTEFREYNSKESFTRRKGFENCYYEGNVNKSSNSFVGLSTCNGLRGMIYPGKGVSFGIWPLVGGEQNRGRRPHLLYVMRWSREAVCGSQVPKVLQQVSSKVYLMLASIIVVLSVHDKRDVTDQIKYAELAIIADKSFMSDYSLSKNKAVDFILETVNVADSVFFYNFNIHLSIVYSELWLDTQRIITDKDIERTLSEAVAYVTADPLYHIKKDVAIFLTREQFANNEITSSTYGDACSSRATAIVTVTDTYTTHETTSAVIHSLAHILGIGHDDSNCNCDQKLCLMERSFGQLNGTFAWEMSSCSVDHLNKNLKLGHLQCLLNKPHQFSQESSLDLCGNGVVNDGEECDCGSRDSCKDECCDPLTCTLRLQAQCASHQACCNKCKFLPKGHVCRERRSACDVQEECDGESGDCPPDGYLVDGTPCGINGQCWKSNCADSESQCKQLWGNNASTAQDRCFERNEMGTVDANCGIDEENRFKKCQSENAKCGLLHCQGGLAVPSEKTLDFYTAHFHHHGRYIQCKTVNHTNISMVHDGSECGKGKVCVQGKCLLLEKVSPPVQCPTTNLALACSGHGHCTTSLKCVCFSGWIGEACSVRTETNLNIHPTIAVDIKKSLTPVTTGKIFDVYYITLINRHKHSFAFLAVKTFNTTTLLAILLCAGILLLVLLVCLLFCYRRRSSSEFLDNPLGDKLNESIPENTDRAIKFGNMPSYRDEKRKRKKNKRVYDALHRINEATDERDSISLKSRESGGKNSAVGSANGSTVACSEQVVGYGVDNNRMFNRVINSSGSFALKNSNSSKRLLNDGEIYSRSPCSEILASPSQRIVYGQNDAQFEKNRSGYATDTELGTSPYPARYIDNFSMTRVDLSPTLSDASAARMTPTPLRLNNIGRLLKQLRYNDDMTSETDPCTVDENGLNHTEFHISEDLKGQFDREAIKLSSSNELPEVCEVRTATPVILQAPGDTSASKKSETVNIAKWSDENTSANNEYENQPEKSQIPPQTEQTSSLFSDPFRLEL
uniref:Disintegrin domain-containing protein n=1 Tax=Syphacia muris TaxID=451379 RepID=A0A158R5T3_9BILA